MEKPYRLHRFEEVAWGSKEETDYHRCPSKRASSYYECTRRRFVTLKHEFEAYPLRHAINICQALWAHGNRALNLCPAVIALLLVGKGEFPITTAVQAKRVGSNYECTRRRFVTLEHEFEAYPLRHAINICQTLWAHETRALEQLDDRLEASGSYYECTRRRFVTLKHAFEAYPLRHAINICQALWAHGNRALNLCPAVIALLLVGKVGSGISLSMVTFCRISGQLMGGSVIKWLVLVNGLSV
ncbi:hypothetical protein CEXT_620121 [Caerostris extrusa]|uniref:Uncharacterized protein n=1 Tax=Caerostris extrusa TaxID=172846 RepID=A0AAV4W1S5_CAEEX|nr:hypothetical protein CEXT_620121 [Caerostris extrusa]